MTLWALFLAVLKSALITSGGSTAFPVLEEDVVRRYRWLPPDTFATAIGLGSVSPGPTGYGAIAVGYYVAGLPGAAVSTLALLLPPLVVLAFPLIRRRMGGLRGLREAVRGITAVSIGLLLLLAWSLWTASDTPGPSAALAAAAFLASVRKLSPPLIIAGGALLGALLGL